MTDTRWAIYVHGPDGDMGDGVIVGPFYSVLKAEAKAESIRNREAMYGDPIECVIVPVREGKTSAKDIADYVQYPSE